MKDSQMFKKDMTSKEMATLSKSTGKDLQVLVDEYKQWEIDTGIVEKQSLPSDILMEKLGTEQPLSEAMMMIIAKALPLLDNKDTMAQGANIITRVYDSIKGNKGAPSISIQNNNSSVAMTT